ncbi:MAG: hypothetical protein KGJ23_11855 [Euryarchaeota archaeon]|nr:hypothetical protein [Euryarchaeota archaeon]MDE1837290.1 hypothetical protein [Euryarchaeota archaeon]MDE1879960.1 hypothetical protein [Euryarchaeota archaeon]MDE2045105.1 hypothetical protein [Thermoplasmata archaeon]
MSEPSPQNPAPSNSSEHRPLLRFLRHLAADPPARGPSVSGGFAPARGQKVPPAPALPPAVAPVSPPKPLKAGIGLERTPVPTLAHAPGTVPYFPPKKEEPKVQVTEEVFRPWSFSVTEYGTHGKEVPRRRVSAEPTGASPSGTGIPS